jgi:hypothetical protein
MMAAVLTQNDAIQCAHGGRVTTSSVARLTVRKAPVLTLNAVQGQTIPPAPAPAACATQIVTGPPPSKPCLSCLAVTAAFATRLTVGGGVDKILLDPVVGTTDGTVAGTTPQPGLKSTPAGPTRLTAI